MSTERDRTGWGRTVARGVSALLGVALASACGEQVDQIRNEFRDLTPHEAYFESLRAVGLAETALGIAWAEAAAASLDEAPTVGFPYEEEGFLFPESPGARSYLVELRRGQRLSLDVELDGDGPTRLFLDIYRMQSDSGRAPSRCCLPIPYGAWWSTWRADGPVTWSACNRNSSVAVTTASS